MSRLPEELIEQIKRLVLIVALLTERGGPKSWTACRPRRSSSDLMGVPSSGER